MTIEWGIICVYMGDILYIYGGDEGVPHSLKIACAW